MPQSLVTGGAGFIGSHVADELLGRGHAVTVLDDLTGGDPRNVPSGAEFVEGSITDPTLIDALFADRRFTYVFHLAAYAAENLSHFIKRFNYTNNLIGSVNLINAAVNFDVRCFVFTSSIAVYGDSPTLPVSEATPASPEDPYGIAKLAVERELAVTRRLFGLNSIVFRPHNVYGERQNIGDRYRNVVGIFMNQLLQNQPMTVFGDGSQQRAFTYIGDVAPVIAQSVDVPDALNRTFNIGSDVPCTVNDLASAVARAMQVSPAIRHLPARSEVHSAYAAHNEIRRVFGSGTTHTLSEGLARMASWVRSHGARRSRPFEDIEIRRHLPSAWNDDNSA